jgi:DNA repair exonuclease SbcCD ATPase subunit
MQWTLIMTLALIQAGNQDPAGRRGQPPVREEVEAMVDAYIISKLQEALQLDDEQYARVIVAQKKLQESRRSFRRQRAETLRELRRSLASAEPRDDQLGSLLDRLAELQKDFEERQRAELKGLDALLTLRQRARYRILEAEIERRLQELVRRVRQGQPRDLLPR